jgi:hypothetical protein
MTTAYSTGDWTGFGAAVGTAAAALAGLLFIAISINIREIIAGPSLPSRAAQTLIMFVTPLVVGLLMTVPDQGRVAAGWELLGTGLIITGIHLYLDLTAKRTKYDTPLRRMLTRVFPALISCGCIAIAGATLLAETGGGLYWLVPGVIVAIIFGLINTWVLLVEILR